MPRTVTDTDTEFERLRQQACDCRNCPLWRDATQTVFGEGPVPAQVMLVGEQPGDKEDVAGSPFIGPAGKLIDRALADVGLAREHLYVTNAVKHFKFKRSGTRRLHKSPAQKEIDACNGWLVAEIALVRPALIVALGATAVRAVLGRPVPILANRGCVLRTADDLPVLLTVHPSSLLRMPGADRDAAYTALLADLRGIAQWSERGA